MNIDDLNLKKAFLSAYIEKQKEEKGESYNINDLSDISIFSLSNEYEDYVRDYVSDHFISSGIDLNSMDLNDLLNLEVNGITIVNPNDENMHTEESENKDESALKESETSDTSAEQTKEKTSEGTKAATTETGKAENAAKQEKSTTKLSDLIQTPKKDTNNEGIVSSDDLVNWSKNPDLISKNLNKYLEDEKFMEAVDTDGDGKVSNEELTTFLDSIKNYDGDDGTVSLKDIEKAAKEISEGTFGKKGDNRTENKENTANTNNTPAVGGSTGSAGSSGASGASGSSGVSGGSGISSASGATNASGLGETSTDNLDSMSLEELKAEQTQAESDVSDKQTALSDARSGNTPELQEQQESIDKAYDEFQKELKKEDKDLAKDIDRLKTNIEEKEEIITQQEDIITEETTNKEVAESDKSAAESRISGLESQKSALQSAASSAEGDGASAIQAKIAEIDAEIAAEEEKIAAAEEEISRCEEAIEEAESLKTQTEEEKSELEAQMDKKEQEVADLAEKNPDLKAAFEEYNSAKDELETMKADAIEAAQSEYDTAKAHLLDVKDKISVKQQEEDKKTFASEVTFDNLGSFMETELGDRLANSAATNVRGTSGYCLGGVDDQFERIFGMRSGREGAYELADILASDEGLGEHFGEVQNVSRDQLASLPAGCVVVWDNNRNGGGSNVSDAGRLYGHISICLGNGQESSDHIQNQLTDRDATYRVFYPKG